MLKKRIAAALILLYVVMSTACGSNVNTEKQENFAEETAEEVPEERKGISSEEVFEKEEGLSSKDSGVLAGEQKEAEQESGRKSPVETPDEEEFDFVLSFAGDICFDETWSVMQYYAAEGEDLSRCISLELTELMKQADLMWINNEFAYSLRGEPLEGKMYTFRAAPEKAALLQELGVDIVGLANNHVYDYGPEAMLDTFDTLDGAGIAYVGAGRNLEEASRPVYFEVQGKTIAYVAASRAEKIKMTPQATEDKPGILRCYDTELFLEEIKEARKQADYVIALVHWGTEYATELEEVQMTTGKEYLDAGADIVIGAHTHCLQGMEFYRGKPIIYSLGNFWFNEKTLDTMLLQVHIYGTKERSHLEVQIIPARQEGCRTRKLEGAEGQELFDFMTGISVNAKVDENGIVREMTGESVN